MTKVEARARLREAHTYLDAAELFSAGGSMAENKVAGSNAILAGIAGADAICAIVLGERSAGDDHAQAVDLLRKATSPSKKTSNCLARLLTDKTPVQYGADSLSSNDLANLIRWAKEIVAEADARSL